MFEEIKQYFANQKVELNPEVNAYIDEKLERKEVHKKDVLLREGETCNHTFFVAKGLLRAYTIDDGGKEHILQFAPEGWLVVDRSSVLFNDFSVQYIDAVEDSELILIPSNFFEGLAELSMDFQRLNNYLLHNHIRHLQKRINLLLSASAEVRYMDFLMDYPDIMMRVPQWMVASYLGITPESLSRVRKELAKKKFITG